MPRGILALTFFAALLAVPARAQPAAPPPAPEVLSLEADAADAALLTWRPTRGILYRLCVTWDRARQQPYACFSAGMGDRTAVGVPRGDGDIHLLSLQACAVMRGECSEPAPAGAIGRRVAGGFDFYATALPLGDGSVQLSSYSLRPNATIAYHQAAPGRPDQRRSACANLGVGACGPDILRPPGALAGVTQEAPGAGSAALVFELRERPHAALLFDDGTGLFTGGRLTAQTVLDEFGVKGTFFLIGRVMRDYPGAVRALVAAGHRVGNHTYSHPSLTRLTDAQIGQELDLTEQQYRTITGGTTKPCFRAPNGAIDRRVDAVVTARGYRQINWTVSSLDWTRNSPDQIIRNVLQDLHNGALISFHTQEPSTMIALRTLIPLLQGWGYVFDLVC